MNQAVFAKLQREVIANWLVISIFPQESAFGQLEESSGICPTAESAFSQVQWKVFAQKDQKRTNINWWITIGSIKLKTEQPNKSKNLPNNELTTTTTKNTNTS